MMKKTVPPTEKLSRILNVAKTTADDSSSYPIISDIKLVEVFSMFASAAP